MNDFTISDKRSVKVILFLLIVPLILVGLGLYVQFSIGFDVVKCSFLFNSGVTICGLCLLLLLLYLFFPYFCACLVVRICNKKISDVTGVENAICLSERQISVNQAVRKKVEKEVVPSDHAKVSKCDEYARKIDGRVSNFEELLYNAVRKGCARKYLNDIAVIMSNQKLKAKERVIYRLIYAFVYDVCDNQLFSFEDYKSRMENAKEILALIQSSKHNTDMYHLCMGLQVSVMKGAFRQDYDKLVVEAYDAIKCYLNKDLQMTSNDKSLIFEMVGKVVEKRDWQKAIPYFNAALQFNPQNATTLLSLAMIYFSQKYDYVAAYDCARRCYSLFTDKQGEVLGEAGEGVVQMILYMSAFARGEYEDANSHISGIDPELKVSSTTGNKAYLLFKLDKFDEARAMAQKALAIDPCAYSALNVLGALALKKGNYAQAYTHCKAAIKGFEMAADRSLDQFFYGELCNNLAVVCFKLSKLDESRTWFSKAISAKYPYVDVEVYDSLPAVMPLR